MTQTKKSTAIKFPPGKIEVYKNAEEIAEYIKEDKNRIPHLVKHEGLPAWKRNGVGPWRALNVDLANWLISQRHKYIGKRFQDADAEIS